MLALLGWFVLAAATPHEVLELHYLNGFVPGTRAVFPPVRLPLMPVKGGLASGTHEVGKIYNSSGSVEAQMEVTDAGAIVRDALMTGLSDAGLKPTAPSTPGAANASKPGADFFLACELEKLSVEKKFTAQKTIHGQYFTMSSRVKLKCVLRRHGAVLYESELDGAEDEPPQPVGAEVFFPLESDPAESLSVALSRAIGALLGDPKFRTAIASFGSKEHGQRSRSKSKLTTLRQGGPPMSEQQNLLSVRQLYQGFIQGDLEAILKPLAEDVDWQIVGHFKKVPWSAVWRGRRELEKYFTILAEALEVELFQPDEFIVDGDKVVVLGHERMVARATGRVVEASWAQVWTFRDGIVIRYREYTD